MTQQMNNRRGGAAFRYEGEVNGGRHKMNEKTGISSYGFNVQFWGGSQFLKLAEGQGVVQDGQWAVFECEVREFDGNKYPGAARVVAVNGELVKPLPTTAKAS